MPKKKSSSKSSRDKKKKDKNEANKADAIKDKNYITKTVETSITLLGSAEEAVVVEALLFLSKYADTQLNNLKFVQSHGIVPKLLPLFGGSIGVMRLSLRLLDQLLALDDAISEMDQSLYDDKILEIANMYVTHADEIVRNFCLAMTEKLTDTSRLIVIVQQKGLVAATFRTLKLDNEILVVTATKLFNRLIDVPSIISELLTVEYDLLVFMTQQTKFEITDFVLEIFRKLAIHGLVSKLVDKLLAFVIESSSLNNQLRALAIINSSLTADVILDAVKTLEFLQFCEWVKDCPAETLLLSAEIFQKVTRSAPIKQLLFDLSVEDAILSFLRSDQTLILDKACEMISNMSTHKFCCQKMLTPIVIKKLIGMLAHSNPNNALKTLHDFSKRNSMTIHMLFEYQACETLFGLLTKRREMLLDETFVGMLEIFNMFVCQPSYKDSLLTKDFYDFLLKNIDNSKCLEILIYCIGHDSFQDTFLELKGPEIIVKNLQSSINPDTTRSLILFIHNSLMNKNIALSYLYQKILFTLKTEYQQMPIVPKILKLIYDLFLPIKFFETNRIELVDTLKDCFYIIKGPWIEPFPFLEILELRQISTRFSIYVVDCCEKYPFTSCNINYGKLSHDPYLFDYVTKVRKLIDVKTTCCNCIEFKIKILAEFIDAQLCGPKETDDVGERAHCFQYHVQSIKAKLGTNMIPIGYLRMGFHCERALLFKALADHLFIPSTLVKGDDRLYWNEIVLVSLEAGAGCLEMFVVDLMGDIGKLYRLGSREANVYCNIKESY